jgi:hypothetical protein
LGFNRLNVIEYGDFNGLLNLRTLDLSLMGLKQCIKIHSNNW